MQGDSIPSAECFTSEEKIVVKEQIYGDIFDQ